MFKLCLLSNLNLKKPGSIRKLPGHGKAMGAFSFFPPERNRTGLFSSGIYP